MAEHAGMHTIALATELAALPGTKPYCFCLENKHHYSWDGTDWIEFPNLLDITQEVAAALAVGIQRANHTGTQSADSITDGSTNKAFTGTEKTKLAGVASGATANDTDANLKNRANHTGTESADVLTDGSTNKAFLGTERTKLAGIATGATANSSDATLLGRANHTGSQTASTISDFAATALAARLGTGAFGYTTGAGGTVTQATNKSTAVTLNTLTGTITMNAAALAAGAVVTFVFNNSQVAAADLIASNHASGGTVGPYLINIRATGAGTASVSVRNTSAGSLSEAIVIRFAVIKAVTS